MLSIIVIDLVNAKFTLDEERLLKADTGKFIHYNYKMISIIIILQGSCYICKIDI